MNDTKLLTVRQRKAIQSRNPDNEDIKLVMDENEELRRLLFKGSAANKVLQKLLDEQER